MGKLDQEDDLYLGIYRGKKNKITVKNLEPNTSYQFRVRPMKINNEIDQEIGVQTEWSDVLEIKTLPRTSKAKI